MNWPLRILVAVFFGFAFFGAIQHYFHLNFWVSTVLAVFGGLFSAFGAALDLLKKWYELRKVMRDDKTAEREKDSVIQSPTADELKKYGRSAVERTLDERYRKIGQVALNPSPFVADSREEKL